MITSRRRIVDPTLPVVSLSEIQQQTRVDVIGSPPSSEEDDLLQFYVAAATSDLEGEDGWLGRALMPQTWRVGYRGFPRECTRNPDGVIFLPYPPLIEVLSVRYRDTGGATVTMVEGTDYEFHTEGDPHGFLAPIYPGSWPNALDRVNSITVDFRCGYDADASPPNPIPDALKHYVLMVAASMYENREADAINVNVAPLKQFRDAAQRCRVYGP